jgi:hypothetical protein
MAVLSLFAGKQGGGKGYKAVYLAPSKFLVVQKVRNCETPLTFANFPSIPPTSKRNDILRAFDATFVCVRTVSGMGAEV